jgi:hypothetical protein
MLHLPIRAMPGPVAPKKATAPAGGVHGSAGDFNEFRGFTDATAQPDTDRFIAWLGCV